MQIGDRCDKLCDRVWVHVDRLHCNERHDVLCVLHNNLGDEPWIDQAVIRVNQHAVAVEFLGPLRDVDYPPNIVAPVEILGLGTGREDAYVKISQGIDPGALGCLRRTSYRHCNMFMLEGQLWCGSS